MAFLLVYINRQDKVYEFLFFPFTVYMCPASNSPCSTVEGLLMYTSSLTKLWCLVGSFLIKFCWIHTGSFSTLSLWFPDMLTWIKYVKHCNVKHTLIPGHSASIAAYRGFLVVTAPFMMPCGSAYLDLTVPAYFLIHGLARQFRNKDSCLVVFLKFEHYFSFLEGKIYISWFTRVD